MSDSPDASLPSATGTLATADLAELAEYLARTSRLTPTEAQRIVHEVIAFLGDTPEEFVRRRHLQLQHQGLSNQAIFERLSIELRALRFRAPEFSERQLRRQIYG
ncbi:MAG TPA: hypothetical protein VK629_17540 [Steroidobacteraceae bacterium]|nr:hypothetical protein [Steroidobacteraceae bacterium]